MKRERKKKREEKNFKNKVRAKTRASSSLSITGWVGPPLLHEPPRLKVRLTQKKFFSSSRTIRPGGSPCFLFFSSSILLHTLPFLLVNTFTSHLLSLAFFPANYPTSLFNNAISFMSTVDATVDAAAHHLSLTSLATAQPRVSRV